MVIYWWSSDLYSWPRECDLCFRPGSAHPNFLAIIPEANEWSIIKIKWLFLECLVLKHHFWNLTFEVHHSLSSLLQASLYSTREKVQVFLLYCKDQIANQGQSLRFQVSSFNVHFSPIKWVIMLKETKENPCSLPSFQSWVTAPPTKLEPAGLSGQHIGLCPDHWLDLILGSPNELSPWSCLITYPTDKPSASWNLHYYIMLNQGSYVLEFIMFHDFAWALLEISCFPWTLLIIIMSGSVTHYVLG